MREGADDQTLMAAFDILLKLTKNILKTPQEVKFRKIKKTNKTIAAKLLGVEGMSELLLSLGFVDLDDESYEFDIARYTDLAKMKHYISDFYDEIRVKYMTPEEFDKHLLLQEQKKEMIEEHKKKQKIKAELQEGMKHDRAEKSQEEVKASKGNQLNFGASVVKFEPPAPARGR